MPMAPMMRTLRRPHRSRKATAGSVEKKLMTPTTPVARRSIELPDTDEFEDLWSVVDYRIDANELLDNLEQASNDQTSVEVAQHE
jgi:hypothetical protein